MAGFLKVILVAILTVACIIVFFNMAFFFPFYLEVIQTAFHVSQIISTDNYLATDTYEDILWELKGKPIFSEKAPEVKIEAKHESGKNAIEAGGPFDVNTYYYPLAGEDNKPYVQMGNLVTITVSAVYPFRMQMFGEQINTGAMDLPVSFTMTTVTTRHYKDLEYEFGPDAYEYEYEEN